MKLFMRHLVFCFLLVVGTAVNASARERIARTIEPIDPDSSVNQFTDLTIGATGYLTGGAGDIFLVSGNFTNGSTQNLLWSTAASELQFKGGTFHTFAMAGADLGPTYFGYGNNFSFATLRLGSGQSLVLAEGNVTLGAAIYVNNLVLEGGLPQISSITGNGFFIYYDPTYAANAYLNAQTYPLAGGGAIQPVAATLKVITTARLANAHIQLTCLGVPNRVNTIQASPDLIQPFVAIGTALADASGNFTFDDPNAGSFTQRFYRVSFP
jgi:hypothetical protein